MTELETFEQLGYFNAGEVIDPAKCRELLTTIRSLQYFGPDIIISEDDYRSPNPSSPTNAGPPPNLLDKCDLRFIEENEELVRILSLVLGDDYRIYAKRVICGVPKEWFSPWIVTEINENHPPNFSGFIKPEYRNLRYFAGIDFHQDLIDFSDRVPDFITLYVYLDEVTSENAPLIVLPGSHLAGADVYPHVVEAMADNLWAYTTSNGLESTHDHAIFTGGPGTTYFWHGCLLHGTLPVTSMDPRISLRYIFEKTPGGSSTIIDSINENITGFQSLPTMVDQAKMKTQPKRAISHLVDEDALIL